ncbi:MAG: hypothetical protein HBSAPP03_20820 [Phycisphaerae bacterium]|nr:MAG: hypothetical protein HBSAPP03_20820 [Phycisphaerae bacterium]
MPDSPAPTSAPPGGILGFIERLGNKLPDPVFLFIGATVVVMALSALGSGLGWSVQPQRPVVSTQTGVDANGTPTREIVRAADGRPKIELKATGSPVGPKNLLSGEGVYWLVSNMVRNFLNFPPLGVVVVGMFGIGLAEKVGLFGASMKWVAGLVPSRLLTPTVVFLGIVSNVASDAGYIVLPPLAGALYAAFGRSPIAGIAAAFAGVSGGFSANLLVGSTDILVGGITEAGARVIDPSYTVLPTCNWGFMAASTVLLTFLGWAVTAWIVEPRLTAQRVGMDVGDVVTGVQAPTPSEVRGLKYAGVALVLTLIVIGAALVLPASPFTGNMPAPAPRFGPIPSHQEPAPGSFEATGTPAVPRAPIPGGATLKPGFSFEAEGPGPEGEAVRGTFKLTQPVTATGTLDLAAPPQPRWSQAIVPIILVAFLVPGLAYGFATGALRTQSDITKCFVHAMAALAPVIAMAFFAAQFLECLRYSRLDTMLANVGGKALVAADLPPYVLLVALIMLVMGVNILMSSMSAKWTALAPIVVPMMMMAGLSPELTQAAYRLGDSCTNTITPLNTYVIVILVAVQRYAKSAGIGNLIAMMIPYAVFFFIVWTLFLLLWVWLGLGTGFNAPLWYTPAAH